MKEFEVNCINKLDRQSAHEHITHIGNMYESWRLTRESAIRRIDSGKEAFYTVDRTSGKKAYIGVVRGSSGNPYLRTHSDGKWNNNLLALQECGASCGIVN